MVHTKMIFHASTSIDELLAWYERIISEEFVNKWDITEPIIYTELENTATNIDEQPDDLNKDVPEELDISQISEDPTPGAYDTKIKAIQVHLVRPEKKDIVMSLYEIIEMNQWFLKKAVSVSKPDGDVFTIPTVWNLFLCAYFILVRDTISVTHVDISTNTYALWIVDTTYPCSKDREVLFGIYEYNSPSILEKGVRHRLYFSSKAHSFFMHAIHEEVHVNSNIVYLVGKLFPQWEYRFDGEDISENEIATTEPYTIQIRQYSGTWMNCPRGFEYRSGNGRDAIFMFRSRWMARRSTDEHPVLSEKTDKNDGSTVTDVVTVETTTKKATESKFKRIHIVSEFRCLFEWIKFAVETNFIDVPVSTYKYNPKSERSKIEYRFTKEECTELSTNLSYEGTASYEWISKILVECMSIRWNNRVLFEEYAPVEGSVMRMATLLSNSGARISYNTYKKARLVSKYVAPRISKWINPESYYVVRLLFTGFGDETVSTTEWIDENENVFLFVWIHRENEEITIRCSSPSTELLSWKKEFDYFLAQWFAIEEVSQ
jgi:hypothetical protein